MISLNKMWLLYRITNNLNGKVYIGQTVNVKERWLRHKRFSESISEKSQYVHRAIAKYGIDNFTFEIIATTLTGESATETENVLMVQYKSLDSQFGYNLKASAEYGGHSEESKQKLRESALKQFAEKGHPATGKKRSEEQLVGIREALSKIDRSDISDETRKKMSESHKGKKQSEELIRKRKESMMATRAKKNKLLTESGILKCSAPNCEIIGPGVYLFINSIRYCAKHGLRLKNTGTLDLIEKPSPNLGRKHSEETKAKLKGKVPHNKRIFSQEELDLIIADPRGQKAIAKALGINHKTVARIKKYKK